MRPAAAGAVQFKGGRRALGRIAAAREIPAMKVRVEVVCTGIEGTEQRQDLIAIERAELVMETFGMSLQEGKTLLEGCRMSSSRTRSTTIWSSTGSVPTAANGTPPRVLEARR
jgi:hypothetical protein